MIALNASNSLRYCLRVSAVRRLRVTGLGLLLWVAAVGCRKRQSDAAPDRLGDLPLSGGEGAVLLGSVAQIKVGLESDWICRRDGQRGIMFTLRRHSRASGQRWGGASSPSCRPTARELSVGELPVSVLPLRFPQANHGRQRRHHRSTYRRAR